jgi:hypothetical protein
MNLPSCVLAPISSSAAINPRSEEAEAASLAWALRYFPKLQTCSERLAKLQAARFSRLASLGLPTTPLPGLQLVCDWIVWLFFYDDMFCDDVESTSADSLAHLFEVQSRMLAILHGLPVEKDDPPIVRMFAGLCERTFAIATETRATGFSDRFSVEIERYFQSNIWEARNLVMRIAPALPIYLKMRPFTGAVGIVFALVELIRRDPLAHVRRHVVVQQLELLANNAICWTNDAGSVDKEIRERNPHNLVLVLCADQQLSLDEAKAQVAAMRNAEEASFAVLAGTLAEYETLATTEAEGYIADVTSFIRGNRIWMQETRRYSESLSMRTFADATR